MARTDHEIIKRVLSGKKRDFALLVERHKGKGMALAMRMLRNQQDAEEALQDSFVRAYKALGTFEGKSSFGTFFYRIVYNVCMTTLQRRGEHRHLSLSDDEDGTPIYEPPSSEDIPDIQYESTEFRTIVKEEIEKLEMPTATILTLFLINEMSYEEIVETTGLSLSTVKIRLFRGRVSLRNAIISRYGSTRSMQQEVQTA
jgi:RNA polymerase sigma-70 factor (ECF subfamily)